MAEEQGTSRAVRKDLAIPQLGPGYRADGMKRNSDFASFTLTGETGVG
jgi:hypothetical protein